MEIIIGTSPLVSIPIVLALPAATVSKWPALEALVMSYLLTIANLVTKLHPQTGCQLNILIINTNYMHLSCWMYFSFCCIII